MDEMIDMMAERFLCWELPMDFEPDAGINFDPPTHPSHPWPVGTNLLTKDQALEMIKYVVFGA